MFTAFCMAKIHLQRTLDGRRPGWSSCTGHSNGNRATIFDDLGGYKHGLSRFPILLILTHICDSMIISFFIKDWKEFGICLTILRWLYPRIMLFLCDSLPKFVQLGRDTYDEQYGRIWWRECMSLDDVNPRSVAWVVRHGMSEEGSIYIRNKYY